MAERPKSTDPNAQQSVAEALQAVRASKAELEEMRRRREDAVARSDKAVKKLRGEGEEEVVAAEAKPQETLQSRIDRVSRMLEEEKRRKR